MQERFGGRPWSIPARLVFVMSLSALVSGGAIGDMTGGDAHPIVVEPRPTHEARHEILVRFLASPAERSQILQDVGGAIVAAESRAGWSLIRVAGDDLDRIVQRLQADPRIEHAEPNRMIRLQSIPDDPLFDEQWPLRNVGQSGGTPGADLRAGLAWDRTVGARQIVVALIDSGVDADHPDLAANLFTNPGEIAGNGLDDDANGYVDDVHGWDFINDIPETHDDSGHGTHQAGIVGAVGNNQTGIAGVAWQVSLLPLKFANAGGFGATIDAVASIDYAIEIGADVILAGWGGNDFSVAIYEAVMRADDAGIPFVTVAGNANPARNLDDVPFYPAAFDLGNVITVAATDDDDALWRFSNFSTRHVDLAAPGVQILSTHRGGGYDVRSGTSAAAAHVAGALVLLQDRFPGLDLEETKQRLLDQAQLLGTLDGLVAGSRRLDLFLPVAEIDDLAPGAVDDLTVVATESSRLQLEWTAPGDDGAEGTAAGYELRYSTAPITAETFADAVAVPDPPAPLPAGERQGVEVTGLQHSTTYFVALRAFDEHGNGSPISNVVQGVTIGPADVRLVPEQVFVSLDAGTIVARDVTIVNEGVGEYVFKAYVRHVAGTPARLLLINNGARTDEIVERLRELPSISRLDLHDGSALPSAEQLALYDAVLLVANDPWSEPIGLGDRIADYADSGGGVVLSLATIVNGWHLTGRFLDEGYYPVNLSVTQGNPSSLGTFDADHPLLQGVSTIQGNLLTIVDALETSETPAFWVNGTPLIAAHDGILALNAFLGDGAWQGDLPQLVGNAAAWTRRYPTWLRVAPDAGRLPGSSSAALSLVSDGRFLDAGSYTAEIVLEGNDTADPVRTIPLNLEVAGVPRIEASETALAFGDVMLGLDERRTLSLRNVGRDTLTIEVAGIDPPAFSTTSTTIHVLPRHESEITLRFAPEAEGAVGGILRLQTNDPLAGELTVDLSGNGLRPAVLEVEPQQAEVELDVGQRLTLPLQLFNSGGVPLTFEAFIEAGSTAEPVETFAADFESGMLTGWTKAPGGGDRRVSADTAADGSGFSYHESGSFVGRFDGIYREIEPIRPGYIGFWVRSGSRTTSDANVVLRDTDGNEVIWFVANFFGRFQLNSEESVPGDFEYEALRWYHVELRNIDFDRDTLDYWIDGVLFREQVPLIGVGPADNVTRIDLFNFNGGSEAWWDELFIGRDAPLDTVRLAPTAGTVAPGAAMELTVDFDFRDAPGGQIDSRIVFQSNDLAQPRQLVPLRAVVHGEAVSALSPAILEFGEAGTSVPERRSLEVRNVGTDRLEITGYQSSSAELTVEGVPLALRAGESSVLTVTWLPSEPGPFSASLELLGEFSGLHRVEVNGTSVRSATPRVEPEQLTVGLIDGSATTVDLLLFNDGDRPWDYAIEVTEEDGAPIRSRTERFADDAEDGENEWIIDRFAGAPLWHRTSRAASSPTTSWWCGDEATGTYDTGGQVSTALVSEPIDLTGISSTVVLEFDEFYETEATWDQCLVDISIDGGASWLPLRGAYGEAPSGANGGWTTETIDLTPFVGGNVRIRFYFETLDGTNNGFAGWFVDDIQVVATAVPWLSASGTGRLAGHESLTIPLQFAAAPERPIGTEAGFVTIRGNAPLRPEITIPVRLEVQAVEPELLAIDRDPKSGVSPGTIEIAIQLPERYEPAELIGASVEAAGVPALAVPRRTTDRNGDGIAEVVLTFDAAALEAGADDDRLVIRGVLTSRVRFAGTLSLRGTATVDPGGP